MKKIILVIFILQTSLYAFCQSEKDSTSSKLFSEGVQPFFDHGQKRLGFTIQISNPSRDEINIGWFNTGNESIDNFNLKQKSFSFGLLTNYDLNNETRIRFRFGVTRNFTEENRDPFFGKGQQTKLHFAPGIVWNINYSRINFYGGFEIPVNLHGEYTFTQNYTSHSKLTLPKGYSYGIGALMGFNYFPIKWLSVGAEFSPSLLYAKLSGRTVTIVEGDTQTYITHDEDKGITNFEQRFSIGISLWL